MYRNQVTDKHRFAKIHRLDCNRDRARFCDLGCEDAAADVHLDEQPTAENVTVRVGVSRHGQRADAEVPTRLCFRIRRRVHMGVAHSSLSSIAALTRELLETALN